MIINVIYNKDTNQITVASDIEDIAPIELNTNSIIDTATQIQFEIAVNTAAYEAVNNPSETEFLDPIE
jgi:hypothetical protein